MIVLAEHSEDRRIAGLGEIFWRAQRWRHLPESMNFAQFLASFERGEDPFTVPESQWRFSS